VENLVTKRKLRQEKLFACVVLGVPLLFLIIKLLEADVFNWDTPSVFLSTAFYRQYLWPSTAGWNPHGFGGFPQGYFSPFLFEWLAGGIGKLLGTAPAVKLLLSFSVILLPFTIHSLLSELGFSPRASLLSLFLFLVSIVLVSNGWSLNGTLPGALGDGRYTSLWCMPFIFIYLRTFRRGVKDFAYLLLASAVFALVLLSDLSSAGILFIISLACCYFYFVIRNRHKLPDYFVHLGLVLILSLVWIGPYFIFRDFAGRSTFPHFGFFSYSTGVASILLGIWGVCIWAASRYKKVWPEPLQFILCALICLVLAYVIFYFFKSFHAQQFIPYLYFFASCIAGYFLATKPWSQYVLWGAEACFVVATIWVTATTLPQGSRALVAPNTGSPKIRGLVNEDTASDFYTKYSNPYQIAGAYLSQNYDLLNGFDIDSSIVAPFIFGFLVEMDKHANTQFSPIAPKNPSQALAHALLLGPTWILSNTLYPKGLIDFAEGKQLSVTLKNQKQGSVNIDHVLYVMPNNLAMFLPKSPIAYPKWNWRKAQALWWGGTDLTVLPVLAQEVPGGDARPAKNESLFLTPVSSERYSLKINSPQVRWVYVKIPYFPDWTAIQDDQTIPLYQAGPNMMALYAKGNVDLIFRRSGPEYLFLIISIGAWILTLFFLIFQFLINSASSRPSLEKSEVKT